MTVTLEVGEEDVAGAEGESVTKELVVGLVVGDAVVTTKRAVGNEVGSGVGWAKGKAEAALVGRMARVKDLVAVLPNASATET